MSAETAEVKKKILPLQRERNQKSSAPTRKKKIMERKWAKELNRHFFKEDQWVANKHMKRYSSSLIIRKMQIKTIMRCYPTPIRMTIIKIKTENNKGRDMEFLCITGKNVKWCSHLWKTVCKFLKKNKQRITIWSSNFSSEYIPLKIENRDLTR